jgi:hypothetical protein
MPRDSMPNDFIAIKGSCKRLDDRARNRNAEHARFVLPHLREKHLGITACGVHCSVNISTVRLSLDRNLLNVLPVGIRKCIRILRRVPVLGVKALKIFLNQQGGAVRAVEGK